VVLGDYPALETIAWFGPHYLRDECTHPVGLKLANPWGLYDIAGNVMEWCWDSLDGYPDGRAVTDWVSVRAETRVRRGGGCANEPELLRSAARRAAAAPDNRWYDQGFRLVRTVP
jgi:formylglycine-generating enzyme required for sulfatase activity